MHGHVSRQATTTIPSTVLFGPPYTEDPAHEVVRAEEMKNGVQALSQPLCD